MIRDWLRRFIGAGPAVVTLEIRLTLPPAGLPTDAELRDVICRAVGKAVERGYMSTPGDEEPN